VGAKYFWTTSVFVGGGVFTDFDCQSINVTYGRTQPTDDFPTATLQLSGILPDSLPAEAKVVGDVIRLSLSPKTGTFPFPLVAPLEYVFYIKNFARTYGTTPNLDTWSITAHGAIGELTNAQLTTPYTTTAGKQTTKEAQDLALSRAGTLSSYVAGESFVSATTFPAGTYVNDIIQTLIRTEQGRINDYAFLLFQSRSGAVGSTVLTSFDDGTTSPSLPVSKYTAVQFENDGNYLANTVVVQPDGLSDVSSGSSQPTLSFNSLDQTTVQATGLADFIRNTINLNTLRPLSVTMLADAQDNSQWVFAMECGTQVSLGLRGTTFNCVIEGVTISANPSATTVTFNLSSAEAYRFLRLDDATFGTLDYNRLGF